MSSDYDTFRLDVVRCRSCTRGYGRMQPVLPEGPLTAKVVIQGTQPGKLEDARNEVYSNESPGGKNFNWYLSYLGLRREEVYITYSVFCRGNQSVVEEEKLHQVELDLCKRWKGVELSFLPERQLILLVGKESVCQWFGRNSSVAFPVGPLGERFAFLPSPGWIMRNEKKKKKVIGKLDKVKEILNGLK